MSVLCTLGVHSWPRLHGDWREAVVEPADSVCKRCDKRLHSVWRVVYPRDGSGCPPGSCAEHL